MDTGSAVSTGSRGQKGGMHTHSVIPSLIAVYSLQIVLRHISPWHSGENSIAIRKRYMMILTLLRQHFDRRREEWTVHFDDLRLVQSVHALQQSVIMCSYLHVLSVKEHVQRGKQRYTRSLGGGETGPPCCGGGERGAGVRVGPYTGGMGSR